MSSATLWSAIRTILTGLGAFFFGKHLLGQVIDTNVWEGWVGLVVGLGSTIWGFKDKSTTLDSLQSFLRSAVIFIGGIFVAKGTITSDQLNAILGVILVVTPWIYSTLSKAKVVSLADGKTTFATNKEGKPNGLVKKAA
jgi:predicted AlkP superfamily pyrophosphatase or phosphodiesterase